MIGKKKIGDFKDEVILDSYQALIDQYYLKERAVLVTLLTEMHRRFFPSAFIVCSVATWLLKQGTSARGRVERNTTRSSGRYAGEMS